MTVRKQPRIESASRLDDQVDQPNHLDAFQPSMFAWTRTVRDVVGLPLSSLSKRMHISKQAMSKLELSEEAGTISINKLEAIADALDCDFVYGFVPRKSFTLSAETLQRQQDRARQAKRKVPAPR